MVKTEKKRSRFLLWIIAVNLGVDGICNSKDGFMSISAALFCPRGITVVNHFGDSHFGKGRKYQYAADKQRSADESAEPALILEIQSQTEGNENWQERERKENGWELNRKCESKAQKVGVLRLLRGLILVGCTQNMSTRTTPTSYLMSKFPTCCWEHRSLV